MANQTPSRIGQINAAGDPTALFLKVFSGEVLTAFLRSSFYRDKLMWRMISSGKSAQFPTTGLATAGYHTPGAEILGQQIKGSERIITIEDLLLASVFVANIDELMTHFDVRGPYTEQIGQALAKFLDQNLSRVVSNAARQATPNVTGLPAGTLLTDADFATDGTKLYGGIFNAGVVLDQNDIPREGRQTTLKPTQYALLVRSEKPIHADLNPGGNGSLAEGTVYRLDGMPIGKTNNYVQSDDRTRTDMPASRQHDYSTSRFQVFGKGVAGTVALQDITSEMAYDIRRQGTLMLSKYLVGHDFLRPEAAVEGITAAAAG